MFVCCECYVLSGRGLCDALIKRPEESYRLWCVVVCGLEASRMRRPRPVLGRSATGNKLAYAEKCVFIATVRQHTAPRLTQYDAVKLHTPGSRVLLEKLTDSQLVKKFPAFFF